MRNMRGTYANQVGTDSSLRKGVGKNMHGNPDKNLRSDIMRRIRQRSESAMTVCPGSLIAKLYDDLECVSREQNYNFTIVLSSQYR